MSKLQITRNTSFYYSPISVRVDGKSYTLKRNKVLEIELPAFAYEVEVSNELGLRKNAVKLKLEEGCTQKIDVSLKISEGYKILLIALLLVVFLLAIFADIPQPTLAIAILVALVINFGIEFARRKSFFVLTES